MKLTGRQTIEVIRLRRMKKRALDKQRLLAQRAEHPVFTREVGDSVPSRPTK